jgi:hypothetical protein
MDDAELKLDHMGRETVRRLNAAEHVMSVLCLICPACCRLR